MNGSQTSSTQMSVSSDTFGDFFKTTSDGYCRLQHIFNVSNRLARIGSV
jgi:hypothetical protein